MARLVVMPNPPTAGDLPDALVAGGNAAVIVTRQGVEVRLQLMSSSLAPVAVRPWVYRGGAWQAMRTDAVAGVGTEPVTADLTKYGGFASGVYMCGPMAVPMVLVKESGDAEDVKTADLDEYFARS